MSGFIQLHRKILKWEWYDDQNTCRLFIHCLLKANHKDNNWRGICVPKGSFISGRKILAQETGMTEQKIRTSLAKLKSTNDITIKTTNKYTIYSIVNWDSYQGKQPSKQPTNNQQITTNNNDNNDNNKRNVLFEDFWVLFPRQRRGDKQKAFKAFERALTKDSYETIMNGLKSYVKSDEVAKGFAKGCEAWLNDSRWLNEYEPAKKSLIDIEMERAKKGGFIC